jgi:hypothetical protein
MRCWKIPDGALLVEAPELPRITSRDPLITSEKRLLLQELNSRIQETGQTDPIEEFCRYYEVNSEGIVTKSYEEYGVSLEDYLYSWSYRVIGNSLWQFWMSHADRREPELKMEALITDLVSTKAPSRIR